MIRIPIFRLTSDPGCAKYELANSDELFTGHPRRDRELDQADDALVWQRGRHVFAIDGSARRKPHGPRPFNSEVPWSSAPSAATRTTSSIWMDGSCGDVGWQDKLQGVVQASARPSGIGESRLPRGRRTRYGREASRRRSRGSLAPPSSCNPAASSDGCLRSRSSMPGCRRISRSASRLPSHSAIGQTHSHSSGSSSKFGGHVSPGGQPQMQASGSTRTCSLGQSTSQAHAQSSKT